MASPRIPDIIYRYTRYHLGATVEFLKQCGSLYCMNLMATYEIKQPVQTLTVQMPK